MSDNVTKWIPLLVVILAGIFALFQIRSNNITNARIKWLENLKQLVADFLSELTILQLKESMSKAINLRGETERIPQEAADFSSKLSQSIIDHLKFIELKHDLIKLNLNPKEILHKKLEYLLDSYMLLFNKIPSENIIENLTKLIRSLRAHSDTMILLVRYIMKLEWEKTKRSYFSRKWYMGFGKGKKILEEALNLSLLPERPIL